MKVLVARLLGTLAIVLTCLCACVTIPTNARDGESLQPNEGLLVFHVTSNADSFLSYVDFSSTSTFGSRFGENMAGPKGLLHIKAGENFFVIPVDAGEYMWSRFSVPPRFAWLQGSNRFRVRANATTYIGHIRINVVDTRLGLQAFDREFEMRTHMADSYPSYFRSMPFEKSIAELKLR